MIKVYQTHTVNNEGHGNCFNACVASIMELPLRKVCSVLPNTEGSWSNQWRVWLSDHGYILILRAAGDPPLGYSIATIYLDVGPVDPDGIIPRHQVAHNCVAFDGVVVHNPHPLPILLEDIEYYFELRPMIELDKVVHQKRLTHGRCIHGYRASCEVCPSLHE